VHGLHFDFFFRSEVYDLYPSKFLTLDESRVFVLNTLFNLPETYLLACLINFFSNAPGFQKYVTILCILKSSHCFFLLLLINKTVFSGTPLECEVETSSCPINPSSRMSEMLSTGFMRR